MSLGAFGTPRLITGMRSIFVNALMRGDQWRKLLRRHASYFFRLDFGKRVGRSFPRTGWRFTLGRNLNILNRGLLSTSGSGRIALFCSARTSLCRHWLFTPYIGHPGGGIGIENLPSTQGVLGRSSGFNEKRAGNLFSLPFGEVSAPILDKSTPPLEFWRGPNLCRNRWHWLCQPTTCICYKLGKAALPSHGRKVHFPFAIRLVAR